MKRLLLIPFLFLGCGDKQYPSAPETDQYIIPSPNVGFTASMYSVRHSLTSDTLTYYVLVTGTVTNRYDKPLVPAKTELRLYLSYDKFVNLTPDFVAFGKIGFFGDAGSLAGLVYTTDTLRVNQRMHHYTKSDEFYWFGGDYVYYDFRIIIGGVAAKQSGVLYAKDITVVYSGGMLKERANTEQ